VSYAAGPRQATLDPAAALAYSTTYTMTVTTGAEDAHGNALAADDVWSFTTSDPPPPPPGEGPGGPILVIAGVAAPPRDAPARRLVYLWAATLAFYLVAERQLVGGLTAGSVKG